MEVKKTSKNENCENVKIYSFLPREVYQWVSEAAGGLAAVEQAIGVLDKFYKTQQNDKKQMEV